MSRTARIAIISLDPERYTDSRYLLRLLQQRWEEQGLRVDVIRPGATAEPADLAILHIDSTRVPDDCLQELSRYPRVLNGRVTDISKRSFSAQLLQRDDAYEGQVIVKTDANYGGISDRAAGPGGGRMSFATGKVQAPWRRAKFLSPEDYPVFDSLRAVPSGVWLNPRLVVEKFLAEREGDLYCLRSWVFLGKREIARLVRSPHHVVKSRNAVSHDTLDDVPDELRAWRARLGFDYGKFDYGIVDGKVVLYDVTPTPTAGPSITGDTARKIMDALGDGLYDYL